MEFYLIIKKLHIITAILSVAGFLLRGWWMYRQSSLLKHTAVKVLPHINDTLLLGAAIYLSVMSHLYPFQQSWLGVKVVLLVGYIVAGTIALKKGKTEKTRLTAFAFALFCVGLIFVHAIYRPIYW